MSSIAKLLFPCKLLVSAISCLLLTIFLLGTFIPFGAVRLFVQLLAKIFRRDLNEILKPSSGALANEDLLTRPEFNIVVCSCYDGEVSIEVAREKLMERLFGSLITNPRADFEYEHLRNSITSFCNFWFWKKQKDFQIQDYVRTYEDVLDEPGTDLKLPVRQVYFDDDLKTIVSTLTTKPWKANFSPWEIIIVNNYCKEGDWNSAEKADGATHLQTVFIYRFHHCIADGYSILNLIIKSNNYEEGEIAAIPSFKKPSACVQLCSGVFLPIKAFIDLTIFFAKQQYGENGWTQEIRRVDGYTYTSTWTCQIPLTRIKSLKDKYRVSFLAVVQGVAAGAFRKMMIASGISVPKETSCFIPLPLPNHRLGLRIHTATAILDLHTGEADVVERVRKTQGTLTEERSSLAPLLILKILSCLGRMPNFLSSKLTLPFLTVGMSPFPGVTAPTRFTPDHECTRTFFTVGLPAACSAACNITTLSSFGNIIFTFTCRNSLGLTRKQLEEFSTFVEDEIGALEVAFNNKVVVG